MNIYGVSVSASAANLYSVLVRLSRTSERNGYRDAIGVFVFASRKQLGEYIERSERTAQRLVSELKRAGLIYVRRMGLHSNDRIYLLSNVGGTKAVNNGGSELKNKSINYNVSRSIHPTDENQHGEAVRMDGQNKHLKPSMGPRETHTALVSTTATKGKPTPKRPRKDRAERRRAARARYAEALRKRLFYGESGQTLAMLDDDGSRSAAAEAAIAMLSDGLAAGRNIKVSGAYLTAAQYWAMVQWLDLETLETVMERVNRAENVRNLTGYLYASLYNECAYRRLSAQVV